MTITVDLGDGMILAASLDDQNFDAPDYDGSLVFEGTVTDDDGMNAGVTIEATSAWFAQQVAAWQNISGDSFVLSINPDASAASLHEVQPTDTGATVTTQSLILAASGSITVAGNYPDLAAALGNDGASDSQVAVSVGNVLSTVVIGTTGQPAPSGGPSFADCFQAAVIGCGNCNKHNCLKTFHWTAAGDCSFDCYNAQECCTTHP
jgi:hypothetical protein